MTLKRLMTLVAVAMLALLVLAACGDDSDADDNDAGSGGAATATTASSSGSGSGGGAITVSMKDTMKFDPASITVKPGEEVTINLKNDGSIKHDFTLEVEGVKEVLDGGKSNEFTFTAPGEPGEYKIFCSQPGHEPAGMVATLIVEQ